MSLFGGGEDVQTYAQSKMSQFEAQLQKIAEVGEDYSSEKLRGLLREANDVIREQLTLLHTLVGNQSRGDALSFLEENSSSEEDKAMEEDTVQIEWCVCYIFCISEKWRIPAFRKVKAIVQLYWRLKASTDGRPFLFCLDWYNFFYFIEIITKPTFKWV